MYVLCLYCRQIIVANVYSLALSAGVLALT